MSGYCVECGGKVQALGLCAMHYMRQRRAGLGRTPEERKRMRMNVVRKPPKQIPAEKRGGMAKSIAEHEPAAIKLVRLTFLEHRVKGEPAELDKRWPL